MRNKIRTTTGTGVLCLALAAGAAALVATPGSAAAGERLRGVTIDHAGVHFDFGPGYHYLYVEYPQARRYFSRSKHYRKAKAFENERDAMIVKLERAVRKGNWDQAERALQHARKAEERRQVQLAKLEEERQRFDQEHRRRERRYSWRQRHRR